MINRILEYGPTGEHRRTITLSTPRRYDEAAHAVVVNESDDRTFGLRWYSRP